MAHSIEKIIKGLEWILDDDRFGFGQGLTKPEDDEEQAGCFIHDAIVLLKEQDAVEPKQDAVYTRIFRCGICGEYVGFIDPDPEDPNDQDNYCRNCGRPVKWGNNLDKKESIAIITDRR